jgi:CheY-like chemotaxis protein
LRPWEKSICSRYNGTESDRATVKILIVEDDRTTRELYRRWFEKADYEVQVASHGRDGIALAASWKPDGVLLDIILPDVDGFEVLTRIKAATPEIPVILCTWGFGADVVERALARGATRVLDKSGLKPRKLVGEFDSAIAISQAQREAA